MQRHQKLVLNFMALGLLLCCGITAVIALTPQEIAEIALDSTVDLGTVASAFGVPFIPFACCGHNLTDWGTVTEVGTFIKKR